MTYFIKKKVREDFQGRPLLQLSDSALKHLLAYPFPGNIRELENLIEHLYVLDKDCIHAKDLPERILQPKRDVASLKLADVENAHIRKVMGMAGGNKSKAMKMLGISKGKLTRHLAVS